MMENKPVGFTTFNAATSSQRDSISLNDNSVNAKAIADALKVDFAVSPGLLRAGDWREGGDYHQEVVMTRLVVFCNAESLLRQPVPTTKPGPGHGHGQDWAWLQKARLGLGTGVNEGMRTQRELINKWRLPPPPSPTVLVC